MNRNWLVVVMVSVSLHLGACNGGSTPADGGGDPDGGCPAVDGAAVPACLRTLTPFPVCGTDYHTYSNPGFAWCSCALVLHDGACVAGEGEVCGDGGTCGAGLSCSPGHGRCGVSDGGV